MLYLIDDLKRDVCITLDENDTSGVLAGLGDPDTLTLEEIIDSKIIDAARTVTSVAPNVMLESGRSFANAPITWSEVQNPGYGMGYLKLPADFLRLVVFRMSDWDYGVTMPIREGDALYGRQFSRFPGIRGNPQRPVVALVNRQDGLYLEFFTCNSGQGVHIRHAQYIAQPTRINQGTQIEICEKLRPAVVYYTAYMVALSQGETALAQTLQATAKELMQMP